MTAAKIAEYKARRLSVDSDRTGRALTPAAVNRPLALLRHLLRICHEEWEVLDAVPRVKLEKEPQGRLRWLTAAEATRLLAACRDSRNRDLADLVELALFTGVRRSEALGLTWDRVDRSRGVIRIEVTKSARRREAPLNDRADAVLARRGGTGDGLAGGLVFRSRNWNSYHSAWERAVERAALADFRFHDLRHTCASWMIQNGASQTEVKDILGHATLAMTARYVHLAPENLRRAAGRLNGVLESVLDVVPDAPARPITHAITQTVVQT